jgi:Arc/MetJ-type ribon-helix-helix transcriptional regulator
MPGLHAESLSSAAPSRSALWISTMPMHAHVFPTPWPWRDVIPPAIQIGMQLVNLIASCLWRSMGALSIRLPDHLEQQLNEEVRLSGQTRSQLLRETLETLLSQRREGRAQAPQRRSPAGANPRPRPPCCASAGPWRSNPEPSIATASAKAPSPGSALLKWPLWSRRYRPPRHRCLN